MKKIVVNNPAARTSGALTILKEFLEKTRSLTCSHKFIVFVTVEELKRYESKNLKIILVSPQGFKNRIIWDNFGMKNYLNKEGINPDLFISIQNTGVNLPKNIPQIIYYHQLLPLCKNNWSLFDKEERVYWKYEKIYPFFIKQYLDRSKIVIVQTELVKKIFSKRFKYPLDKIYVQKPEMRLPKIEEVKTIQKDKFRIFYPATPLIYKNHKVVIEALGELKREIPDLSSKLECIFTFSEGESKKIDKIIAQNNLGDTIKLIGETSYEKVLEYYKSSNLLVFPSYIETLGLPLLEAKSFGLNILATDMEYSRRTIGEYVKINFIDSSDKIKWKKNIHNELNIFFSKEVT